MKVGLIGTGAIANKHAQAYKNIGYQIVAVSNRPRLAAARLLKNGGARFIRIGPTSASIRTSIL